MSLPSTQSVSRPTSRTSTNRVETLSAQDEVFIEAVKNLSPGANRELSPTQNFCMRLAAGLEKLPPRIKNQLELEFLTRLTEMENKYIYDQQN